MCSNNLMSHFLLILALLIENEHIGDYDLPFIEPTVDKQKY